MSLLPRVFRCTGITDRLPVVRTVVQFHHEVLLLVLVAEERQDALPVEHQVTGHATIDVQLALEGNQATPYSARRQPLQVQVVVEDGQSRVEVGSPSLGVVAGGSIPCHSVPASASSVLVESPR